MWKCEQFGQGGMPLYLTTYIQMNIHDIYCNLQIFFIRYNYFMLDKSMNFMN
jgi:hypothetical protein